MAETSNLPFFDDTRGPQVLAVTWLTQPLAMIAVALRLYLRIKAHSIGWDDHIICLGLLSISLGSVCNTLQVHYGFGRHVEYILPTIPQVIEWTTIAIIISYVSIFLVKISVALFILRVIKRTHRPVRIALYCLMVFLALSTLAAIIAASVECIPLKKLWEPHIAGTCYSSSVSQQVTRVFGAVGATTDLLCVIIPCFIIRGLQMNRRTKNALLVILMLGLVPAACAIGKSVTTKFSSKDVTWDQVPVEIWTVIEANFGVFVACLPALRSLFSDLTEMATRLLSRKIPSYDHNRRTNSSNHSEQVSIRKIDPNAAVDTDGVDLIPMNNIAVKTTTAVSFGQSDSISIEAQHPWEHS